MRAHQVILDLWAQQPGLFFCLSTKDRDGRWRDHFFERGECDMADFIAEHEGDNVFFCPHGFSKERRLKQYAVLPRCCWADLDRVNPRRIALPPTVAIASSPGRFVGLWRTDRTVTEDLNKRLTYAIGADKGGWDLTQVLRLPGSINHKPQYRKPRVRLLWDDGAKYCVDDLDDKLPVLSPVRPVHTGDRRASSSLSAAAIIAKHGLNGRLVRQLMKPRYALHHFDENGKLKENKKLIPRRHRVHWRLANELHDAGVPRSEAFVLLVGTPWNKHDSDAPVWTMIDKIWE